MPPDDAPSERLTYDEVDLVLRKATELQHGEPSADQSFSLGEVERLGAEIGLSPQAVRTALVHVRTSALVPTATSKPSLADRMVGPTQLVVQRRVRGTGLEVRARLDESLRKQLFRVKRNFGDRVQWERAEGLFSQFRRALDFGDLYTLRDAELIDCTVIEVPGDVGEVEIVLVGSFAAARREQATGVVVGTGLMTAGSLVGASLLATLGLVYPVVIVAGGLGMSALVVTGTRRSYLQKLQRTRDALERLLDDLEHGR